jgi:hypothetical protein
MRSSRIGDLVFVKGLANNGKYEKLGDGNNGSNFKLSCP